MLIKQQQRSSAFFEHKLNEDKADIKARNNNKGTFLHCTATNNSTEVAQLLLEHNADIEARDDNNRTPLHVAVSNSSTEVLRLLLKYNPDIGARDRENITPVEAERKNMQNAETLTCLFMENMVDSS